MNITKKLSEYIKREKINLSDMARVTGVPYKAIYSSLGVENRRRPLRVDEAYLICRFLGKKIEDFADGGG